MNDTSVLTREENWIPPVKSSRGLIIIVSAPSGTGKSTIIKELLRSNPELIFSVSVTSRPKREQEDEGKSYYFVSDEVFKKYIEEDKFAEWAKVHRHYYGTLRSFLEESVDKGKDILLDVDTQGAASIKKSFPESVMIFILPPSIEVLKKRLEGRMTEEQDSLELRLHNARGEIKKLSGYEYVIVNDTVENATEKIESIIKTEHCRLTRTGKADKRM